MEGRMDIDLGSVFVACDLNLNWGWWGCCGVPPQVNLRSILILTGGKKHGKDTGPRVGVEWPKEFYGR